MHAPVWHNQIQIKNVNFRIIEIKKIKIKNSVKFITKKKFYKFYNNWTLIRRMFET